MIGSRAEPRAFGAALVVLGCLAAGSAAAADIAQAGPPVRLTPPPGSNIQSAPPPAPAAEPPAAVESATPTEPASTAIEVGQPAPVSSESVGLLDPEKAGLPATVWEKT